jgi:hypothetical protein
MRPSPSSGNRINIERVLVEALHSLRVRRERQPRVVVSELAITHRRSRLAKKQRLPTVRQKVGGSRRSEEISPRRHASRSTTPLIGALLSCGHAASRDPDGRRTGAVCVVAGAACVSRPVQTCRTPCARVSGYPVGTGGCRAIRFRAALCGVVISGPCRSFSSKPPLGRGLRLPW